MLSSSSSDHLSLTQDLYQRVLDSIYQSCGELLQECLDRCNFGIAPDAKGISTLFIIAPNQTLAEQLVSHIAHTQHSKDSLLSRISAQMIGIHQTTICFVPITRSHYSPSHWPSPTEFLVGRIFPHYL